MNWNKTYKLKIKGHSIEAVLYLDHDEDLDTDVIRIHAMLNEYYMTDFVVCGTNDRDFNYYMIQNFPVKVLELQLERLAWDNGALG